MKKNLYSIFCKRLFDIILSLFLIVIISPILLTISLFVRIKLGSPVFFTQPRPGKNEKIFNLVKFRSMTNAKDDNGDLLPDNQRLTQFGQFLRKSSIDELPELWNILKGEMSFIGPRPLSIFYTPFYNSKERIRSEVRPGLTGLAQVNGRNNAKWETRFDYDTFYVNNLSFKLDMKVLYLTIMKVIKQSDVEVRDANSIKNFNVYRKVQEEGEVMPKEQRNEIGSEFEYSEPNISEGITADEWLVDTVNEDYTYSLSGRSAIGIILDDISKQKKIETAYLPNYSCVSMIQPFLDRNINIEFYDVKFANHQLTLDIDTDRKVDVFLFMQYFGFNHNQSEFEKITTIFREKNVPILQDITQNLLNENRFYFESDYYAASVRKWFAVASGGIAYKHKGKFSTQLGKNSDEVVARRIEAMHEKQKYILGQNNQKEIYLKKFGEFNNSLIRVDKDFNIDSFSLKYLKSINVNEIRQIRSANSKFVLDKLKGNTNIKLMFTNFDSEIETPLFIPIILDKEDRDNLRKYLIDNQIYLPVHWPEKMGEENEIKDSELSIVIDQRYNRNDMNKIIETLNAWYFKEKGDN